jgi:hypothetical protein
VFMSAKGGTGQNEFWAGAGNDTIWTGLGNDTVFVFADHTANAGAAPNHLIRNFGANDTLWINGYSSSNFTSSSAGTVLNLSDGTKVTFAGITDPNTIKIVG